MPGYIVADTSLTFVDRSRLKTGSALLALVILVTTSIAFANGQIPGLQ